MASAPSTVSIGHPAGSPALKSSSAARRRWSKHKVLLTALLLIAAVATSAAWKLRTWISQGGNTEQATTMVIKPTSFAVTLKEKGELRASKSTDIICEVEGRTTIIKLIPEGTAVKQGDLLVQLASDKIEERIQTEELKEANAYTTYESAKTELDIQRDRNASDTRKAELQIELKRIALERYEQGDWQQQLKDADISIEQAQILSERRAEDRNAAEELFKREFITKTEYEEDLFNHQKAIWDLDKARMAKEVLVKYTHVAELTERQSDLDEAVKEAERVRKAADAEENKKLRTLEGAEKELKLIRDQLAKLRTQLEKCRITAPTQGFVVYYSGGGGRFMMNDDQIREGAEVHERQILMQLPDTSEMVVDVRIHEAKTDKLSLNLPARMTIEGVPGKSFTGRVTKIAALADTQNRWLNPDLKEYQTEILLDKPDVPLKPGVTAHVEIIVDTLADRLAVPIQSVYTKAGSRFVFRTSGNQVDAVPVRLGAVGTEWAEIVEGVNDGDSILLAFSDEHKRIVPDVVGGGSEQRPGRPGGSSGPRRTQMQSSAGSGAEQSKNGNTAGGTQPAARPERQQGQRSRQ